MRIHDQGLRCPLPESLDTIDCINGKQRPGKNLPHGQDGVNPHNLRMLEVTLSFDAARLVFFYNGNLVCQIY